MLNPIFDSHLTRKENCQGSSFADLATSENKAIMVEDNLPAQGQSQTASANLILAMKPKKKPSNREGLVGSPYGIIPLIKNGGIIYSRFQSVNLD